MSLAEVEKSGKGSKISDRLAAIEAEGKKWERKYEKVFFSFCLIL